MSSLVGFRIEREVLDVEEESSRENTNCLGLRVRLQIYFQPKVNHPIILRIFIGVLNSFAYINL